MKSIMRKTTMREIRMSFGRFFAILAIVALGVGFFAGLKVTKSTMLHTLDEYLQNENFYDFRLLSTVGFSKEDMQELKGMPDVSGAAGAVFKDILFVSERGSEGVLKVHSLTDEVNGTVLLSGRMPQAANECVVDSNLYTESDIGSKVIFSKNNTQEDLDFFTSQEYEIVGIVSSSYYINFERGNTALGSGRVNGFMYIPEEGFDCDYYMEIFVAFSQKEAVYSQEYQDFIDERQVLWEETAEGLADSRFQEVTKEARQEIEDAQTELSEKQAEAEQELLDAKQELLDGEQELSDGEQALADAKQKIADKEKELSDGKTQIVKQTEELERQEAALPEKEQELKNSEAQLIAQEQNINLKQDELLKVQAVLYTQRKSLEEQKASLDVQYKSLKQQESSILNNPAYAANPGAFESTLNQIRNGLATVEGHLAAVDSGFAKIDENQALIENGFSQIQSGREQILLYWAQLADGKTALAAGKEQIAEGRIKLEDAKAALADGEKQIADAKAEILDKEEELAEAKEKFADGWLEYNDARKEFDTEIADAQTKIADAKQELEDLENPEVYVLGRNTNIGYACFENDANIVEGIANVFPIFFFLVAALVCITTMNRMVEEQRTQIGVLKALGYSEGVIMSKFMIYSGSAALIGGISGFYVGTHLFPYVIWTVYHIMYSLGDASFIFDWKLALVSLIVSLLCSLGATWFSCRYELSEGAANLMRPKAPKAGKRVLLERLPFVWKRLKFLHKVSIRNIFRYKKRFFMMIIGISGCTALLVTGLGIKDSIANVAVQQFEEIQTFDASVTFSEAQDILAKTQFVQESETVADMHLYVMEKAVDLEVNHKVKGINLVVLQDEERAENFLNLHTSQKEKVAYPQAGECVISDKAAENFRLKVGDTVILRDEEMREARVTVSGIFENYIYNYIYLSPGTYQEKFGIEPEYKTAYINFKEGQDVYQAAAALMETQDVSGVTVNADIQERFGSMLSSLDYIVILVIGCAALLAFIVLYNLTNINITERVREIATIKVLGFYKKETSAYVFRENMVLTAIGSIVGLGLGYFLHNYVMHEVNIDMISFDIHIIPFSYIAGILLTFLFAWFINLVMSAKLEKINMAESLKSVD